MSTRGTPRTPWAALGWWPLRLSPLVALPLLAYVALWALTSQGSDWGYVMFPLVAVGLWVAVGYGLPLGLVAAVALRTWRHRPRTAGTVVGMLATAPVLGYAAMADTALQGVLRGGLALVVALVVGLATAADARRIAATPSR